ncbi:MAG: hypothetical protein R2865_14935 [Deinococcales bacterium]
MSFVDGMGKYFKRFIKRLEAIEDYLVFMPRLEPHNSPDAYGLPYEKVQLQSDPKLSCWLLAYHAAAPWLILFTAVTATSPISLVMLANSGNLKLNIMLAEYRGFFFNEGKPSERRLYADAEAHYDYLIRQTFLLKTSLSMAIR